MKGWHMTGHLIPLTCFLSVRGINLVTSTSVIHPDTHIPSRDKSMDIPWGWHRASRCDLLLLRLGSDVLGR